MGKIRAVRRTMPLWLPLIGIAVLIGTAAAAERMSVKVGVANIRSGPGTENEVLWQVEKYHPFIVKKKKGKWFKVQDFEKDQAWVHSSVLGKMESVITIKSSCNVRAKATVNSKKMFTAERGTPFKVLKHKGNWIHIEHKDGEKGWIRNDLVW